MQMVRKQPLPQLQPIPPSTAEQALPTLAIIVRIAISKADSRLKTQGCFTGRLYRLAAIVHSSGIYMYYHTMPNICGQ